MERLIIDTSSLVEVERGRLTVTELIAPDDDIVMAAITAAELLTGVELASEAHRERRQAFLTDLLAVIPIEAYDLDVARMHARLLAATHRAGRARGAHDLIIAATAAARDRIVITHDPGGFDGLPGVSFRAP